MVDKNPFLYQDHAKNSVLDIVDKNPFPIAALPHKGEGLNHIDSKDIAHKWMSKQVDLSTIQGSIAYRQKFYGHTAMPKRGSSKASDGLQIKTPQALIHIEHRISLLQYKYWILLLREYKRQYDANIPAEEGDWRYMPMAEIAKAIGYVPNKKELWDDLEALKNQTIAYNFLSKDGGTAKRGTGFITEWEVHATRIGFKFPSFIIDVVKGLDEPRAIFQLLNWQIFNAFSGKYEAIIYKLCRDYRGVRKTPYFDLASFRKYMGIEEHEYKEFRDLNRLAIAGPVKTINNSDVSDLRVEVEYEKRGRKVIGLRFLVEAKQQSIIPFDEIENLAFRFAKVPIDLVTQQKYLEMRSPEEVEKCIERANQYGEQEVQKGKSNPNYGALYRKAIQEGWHTTLIAQEESKKAETRRKQVTKKAAEAKEAEEAARNAEIAARINAAFSAFDALSEERKDEIREAFRTTIAAVPPMRKSFDKQGEQAPIIRSQFADYFMSLQEAHTKGATPAKERARVSR